MSVTSKIPQNRGSRLAAPSKLPSRILRPTFTNKTQSGIPNFVTSAKQVEKRKETTAQVIAEDCPEVDSNRNIKNSTSGSPKTSSAKPNSDSTLQQNANPAVDCNGNKRLQDKKTVSENQVDQQALSATDKKTKMYSPKAFNFNKNHHDHQNTTVTSTRSSNPRQNPDTIQEEERYRTSGTSPSRLTGTTSPNFRSIKPGYFLQKVYAIKSSHQKAFAEKQVQSASAGKPQPFTASSKLTLPFRAASYLNRGAGIGKATFGLKSEDQERKVAVTSETSTASTVLRPPAPVGKSRMAMKSTATQPAQGSTSLLNKPGTYVSRAEKRKKYLEAKSALKNSQENEKINKDNMTLPLGLQQTESTLKSDSSISQVPGNDTALRRPYFRKQGPRSARIARPVPRPKKTPSPITFVPSAFSDYEKDRTNDPQKSEMAEKDAADAAPSTVENATDPTKNNSFSVTRMMAQAEVPVKEDTLSSPEKLADADHQSVASALSEESGYSSVTSTMHAQNGEFAKDTATPPSGFVSGWRWKSRPYWSETDAAGPRKVLDFGREQRQHSYSVSDVQSTNASDADHRNLEHQRYCSYLANKNLVTFGQYRVQVEGNYAIEHRFGVTEGSQIRSSVGHEDDFLFHEKNASSTPSPETCENENTSDSSAETVIPNTKSPQPVEGFDVCDRKGDVADVVHVTGTTSNNEVPATDAEVDEATESSDDVFDLKQVGAAGELNPKPRNSYQFVSASDETVFMTMMNSPEPTPNVAGTPSSNSAHKSKKRKTDSILMSPLLPEDEVSTIPAVAGGVNQEHDCSVLEEKIIFDSDPTNGDLIRTSSLDDTANEESLSQLIDLPSLHESALMADYNSLLEDDLSSDADSDQEDPHGKGVSDDVCHHPVSSPTSKTTNDSQNVQTNVINKLLSKGVNGIVRSEDDVASAVSSSEDQRPPSVNDAHESRRLVNGYHAAEDIKSSHSIERQIAVDSASYQPYDLQKDEIIQEYRLMKMSLTEVYRILEADEEKMEKQVQENKRLQMKNQKLTQTVESLTRELAAMKLSVAQQSSQTKETQVEVECADVSTHTEPGPASAGQNILQQSHQDAEAQVATAPHWYHTEVSDKVQCNIEEASEEIKYVLKDLRGDFDKRINDAVGRLQSAIQLMHR